MSEKGEKSTTGLRITEKIGLTKSFDGWMRFRVHLGGGKR